MSEESDPILDEVERKMAMGEVHEAMRTREFWELTQAAIQYARFVYDNARKNKFSRKDAMSLALDYSKILFFNDLK